MEKRLVNFPILKRLSNLMNRVHISTQFVEEVDRLLDPNLARTANEPPDYDEIQQRIEALRRDLEPIRQEITSMGFTTASAWCWAVRSEESLERWAEASRRIQTDQWSGQKGTGLEFDLIIEDELLAVLAQCHGGDDACQGTIEKGASAHEMIGRVEFERVLNPLDAQAKATDVSDSNDCAVRLGFLFELKSKSCGAIKPVCVRKNGPGIGESGGWQREAPGEGNG